LTNQFITDKKFYGGAFRLILPIVALSMTQIALGFSDMFMFGLLDEASETAIAATRIAMQPFFLFAMILFGAMSGAAVLCSQYWGKKDTDTINAVTGATFLLIAPVCALFMTISILFAPQLMSLLSNDSEVIGAAVTYLRIIAVAFMFELVTGIFSGTLRSVENVRVPMLIGIGGIAVNITLNAFLIFGLAGVPAMGVPGVAVATLISHFLRMLAMLTYIIFLEKRVNFSLKKMLNIRKVIIRDFFKYATPVIGNEFFWGFGTTIHMAIIGAISSEAQSAYIVSNTMEAIAGISMMGFSTAASITIGKAIGGGQSRGMIARYARTFLGLGIIAAVFTISAVFMFRNSLINLFGLRGETQEYAAGLFVVVTIVLLVKTCNCIIVVGIFRGGGDTKTGMIIDMSAMYFISIPSGFIAMYFLNLNVVFVYAALMLDEIVKLPILLMLFRRRKWIKNITRDFEETQKTS